MAISRKTGKPYYTDEEKEAALQNNNALEYALSHGYNLVRHGNTYQMKEHDSMVFKPDGSWFWNSQGKSGHAIDFLMEYEGYSYTEAILELAGAQELPAPKRQEIEQSMKDLQKPKLFILPEKAANYRRMFAYLVRQRGIDHNLVSQLEKEKKLYQGVTYAHFDIAGYDNQGKAWYTVKDRFTDKFQDVPRQKMTLYTHNLDGAHIIPCIPAHVIHDLVRSNQTLAYQNVIMVGYTPQKQPYYASMRAMTGKYKVDVTGSRKDYGFCINENADSNTVCVFESPIEAMSYWSMCKLLHSPRISCPMISLGGVSTSYALKQFLQDHPKIQNIITGLNIDTAQNGHTIAAGQLATDRIRQEFGNKYKVAVHKPTLNDWNDVLVNYRNNLAAITQQLQPARSAPVIHHPQRGGPSL